MFKDPATTIAIISVTMLVLTAVNLERLVKWWGTVRSQIDRNRTDRELAEQEKALRIAKNSEQIATAGLNAEIARQQTRAIEAGGLAELPGASPGAAASAAQVSVTSAIGGAEGSSTATGGRRGSGARSARGGFPTKRARRGGRRKAGTAPAVPEHQPGPTEPCDCGKCSTFTPVAGSASGAGDEGSLVQFGGESAAEIAHTLLGPLVRRARAGCQRLTIEQLLVIIDKLLMVSNQDRNDHNADLAREVTRKEAEKSREVTIQEAKKTRRVMGMSATGTLATASLSALNLMVVVHGPDKVFDALARLFGFGW